MAKHRPGKCEHELKMFGYNAVIAVFTIFSSLISIAFFAFVTFIDDDGGFASLGVHPRHSMINIATKFRNHCPSIMFPLLACTS